LSSSLLTYSLLFYLYWRWEWDGRAARRERGVRDKGGEGGEGGEWEGRGEKRKGEGGQRRVKSQLLDVPEYSLLP